MIKDLLNEIKDYESGLSNVSQAKLEAEQLLESALELTYPAYRKLKEVKQRVCKKVEERERTLQCFYSPNPTHILEEVISEYRKELLDLE
jgi:hypothetical protein